MQDFAVAFTLAVELITAFDSDLVEIVGLSLYVSLTATLVSCVIGLPLGALMATSRFRGRRMVAAIVNALMGLPPVVIGLVVYLYLSRSGPLGWLGLLYTPTAMIIAQVILITPIVAALSRQVLQDLDREYADFFRSLRLTRLDIILTLLREGRFALLTVALAGFGRAIAEVGAVIIVGGNIDHLTRVMTTAIALETSRGDLPMALALGMVLLATALAINAAVAALHPRPMAAAHA